MPALTVALYAASRNVSESTVKNWIRKLNLELPDNPLDNRQRVIMPEHKRLLDACGSAAAAPAAAPAPDFFDVELVPDELKPYDRSEQTGLLIAEGAIALAQTQAYNASPDSDQVIERLKLITATYEEQNTQALAQYQNAAKSALDRRAALDAARFLQLKQAAQRRGIHEYQFEKAIVEDVKTQLELIDLGVPVGKSPAVAAEELDSLLDTSSPLSPSQSAPPDLF